jgi:hexokinase
LQAFEKFISGMYLGEITRNLLVSLIDATPKPLVFDGRATEAINTQWGVDTSVMSEIEEAWINNGAQESAEAERRIPKFSEFRDEDLTANTRQRLEKIKGVIVKRLGYADQDVSLRDAAVRLDDQNPPPFFPPS